MQVSELASLGNAADCGLNMPGVIRELRPRFVVVENVAALAARGLDAVLGSLSEAGYDALWFDLRAADVGAPHRRERLFIVGWRRELEHTDRGGCGAQRFPGVGAAMDDGGVVANDATTASDSSARQLADAGCVVGVGRSHGDARGGSDGPSAGWDEGSGHAQRGGETRFELADPASVAERESTDEAHALADRGDTRPLARSGGRDRRSHTEPDRRRLAQPGLRGGVDGLPEGLDAHRWPSRPGEAQREDEAPRVTTESHDRARRLKALGNAVVPQCGYVVGCVVAEVLRGGAA